MYPEGIYMDRIHKARGIGSAEWRKMERGAWLVRVWFVGGHMLGEPDLQIVRRDEVHDPLLRIARFGQRTIVWREGPDGDDLMADRQQMEFDDEDVEAILITTYLDLEPTIDFAIAPRGAVW